MGNNKKEKSNTKIAIIFATILIISGFVGYFTSAILTKIKKSKSTMNALKNTTLDIAPYFIYFTIAVNIIALLYCIISYNNCRKTYKSLGDEDYDKLDELEIKLGHPLYVASISMILNLFFFTMNAYITLKLHVIPKKSISLYTGLLFGVFFFSYIWEVIIQAKAVSLEKEMNPEKKGNILDTKFVKDWIDSCDEAQKMTIYKSAYASYSATSAAFMIMWVISLLGMLIGDQGMFAPICVTILWLVQILSYSIAGNKYEKEGIHVAE